VKLHFAVNQINDIGRVGTPVEYLVFVQRVTKRISVAGVAFSKGEVHPITGKKDPGRRELEL
jgi:hypothetical protein